MKNRLRDMREDHDLEQKDVARLLGISRQYYSRYELGQVDLPIRHYVVLAEYYNISIDYLCGACDTPKPLHGGGESITSAPTLGSELAKKYRANPQLQPAVDKLLDIKK